MRATAFTQRLLPAGLAAFAVALTLAAAPALSATAGKEVPTETIIVPDSAGDAAMPDVPPDANEPAEAATPEIPAGSAKDEPLPVVEYGDSDLPEPVARLRAQIMEAASTGDPEKLRAIIDAQDPPTTFSANEIDDPITFLKESSGDEGGREILAVLIEVLQAGHVHVDVGTPNEMYLWPYFAAYPVDALTPPQLVELFKLVYAGDYEDMKTYQSYLYYRVGISPDGTWRYFIADN